MVAVARKGSVRVSGLGELEECSRAPEAAVARSGSVTVPGSSSCGIQARCRNVAVARKEQL